MRPHVDSSRASRPPEIQVVPVGESSRAWVELTRQSGRLGRLGPSLGGQGLGISHAFSQTRLVVPSDAAQSVHGMPPIAGSIELGELYRTIWLLRLGSKRHGRSRYNKVRSANILCVNQLAVVCRARYSLRMARILRGSGTSQRCALPATPRTRPCTPAHDCR